jgi:hypothetical protein
MLVENNSIEEIITFKEKVFEKYTKMMYKWLGKKVVKFTIDMHKKSRYENKYGIMEQSFLLENQKMCIRFEPQYDEKCRCKKFDFYYTIDTFVETSRGKLTYSFTPEGVDIFTPHYNKRHKERIVPKGTIVLNDEEKQIQYKRNGKVYELTVYADTVSIRRKLHDDVSLYITCLHKGQCRGKNYQELFNKLNNNEYDDTINSFIDENDVYEWK